MDILWLLGFVHQCNFNFENKISNQLHLVTISPLLVCKLKEREAKYAESDVVWMFN